MSSAQARVPAAAPTRLSAEEAEAVGDAIMHVLKSDRWVLGSAVERFEEQFAAYVDSAAAVGVASGSDALVIALASFDLPPGSGVLVPANDGSFAAMATRRAGLVPIAMDVDVNTLSPTAAHAQEALAEATTEVRALILTHLHGDAAPVSELDAWRRQHDLVLIEDCAQAHGLRVQGRHVGTTGDAATFSFYPTKNLGAVGDGGAVTFPERQVAAIDRARHLRQYGWEPPYRVSLTGGLNSRLDEVQAAVLSARLSFLDTRNARRREIAARLRTAGENSGLTVTGDPAATVAHHLVVRTSHRDALAHHLGDLGVQSAVHYPFTLSEMPGLGPMRETPAAALLAHEVLSLPCFPEMREDEVVRVCHALTTFTPPNQQESA